MPLLLCLEPFSWAPPKKPARRLLIRPNKAKIIPEKRELRRDEEEVEDRKSKEN
jgi:hypothetical protein